MNFEPSQHYGNWTGTEIEEFLSETRVPLRLSFVSKAGLLIVPVWFEYRASCFWSCSPNDSLLVKTLGAFKIFLPQGIAGLAHLLLLL